MTVHQEHVKYKRTYILKRRERNFSSFFIVFFFNQDKIINKHKKYMKIIDLLDNTETGKRKNSSLIVNLKNIKFSDLMLIKNYFNNPKVLNNPENGWYAIHYATLNSDHKVLNEIIKLYQVHNINISLEIDRGKEMIPEQSNSLDIAYHKNMCWNMLLLKKYGLVGKSIYKLHYSKHSREKNLYLNLPLESSPLSPFFYSQRNSSEAIVFFTTNKYDEKEEFINNFHNDIMNLYDLAIKQNNIPLFEALNEKINSVVGDIKGKKDIISIHYKLGFVPLIKWIELYSKNPDNFKKHNSFSSHKYHITSPLRHPENNHETIVSTIAPYIVNDNNFIKLLINTKENLQKIINEHFDGNNNSINKNFLEFEKIFKELNPLFLNNLLDNTLSTSTTKVSRKKI